MRSTIDIYSSFKNEIWNEGHTDEFVVCACAKNENAYIEEWIDHYLSIGFDRIILADNNDDDSLLDIVSKYGDSVVVIDARCTTFYQVEFYAYFCRDNNFKWCAFFDIDEFLEINRKSIKDQLSNVEGDVVCFNWVIYGSNGLLNKTEGGVQDRFKLPIMPLSILKENTFIKSIVRGGNPSKFEGCFFNGSHLPFSNDRKIVYNCGGVLTETLSHSVFPLRYKYGYLKHYYTKSFDEWKEKARRGWPDGTDSLAISYYFMINSHEIPITEYMRGLFDVPYEIGNGKGITDEYDVIAVKVDSDNFIMATIEGVSKMMQADSGHTFIINGEIDDTLYGIFLEMAIKTGNKLVYCETQDECWEIYLENNKGRNYTYYIITFN